MDGYVTIGTQLDTSQFDAQIDFIEGQLQDIEDKVKQADMGFEVGDTQKLEAQYEKLSQKLTVLKQKKEELNKSDLSRLTGNINNVGKSTSDVIKKVARWGLAVFGVRSAYLAVRKMASTLSQTNEQIKTDLDYINFAIASAFKPVVEALISLMYKLLSYVSYIAKAWFNINLFGNATADAFKNANKQAKDLKKTTAGFDELNILQDNGQVTSTTTPSFGLAKPEEGKIPSWIKWIADNKNVVISALAGIALGLTAVGLGFSFISGFGIGLIFGGLYTYIEGLIEFLNDPTWESFSKMLKGISLVIAGIAILMGSWIVFAIALGIALLTAVVSNWDKIKAVLGKVGSWIYENIVKPVGNFFVGLWNGLASGASKAWSGIKSVFGNVYSFFKGIFNTVSSIFKSIGTTIGTVVGNAFKGVINGILKIAESILNAPISAINTLIGVINKIPGIELGKIATFKLPRLATGGIINQPGRGIPVGGQALGGESGAEGVIPLTDSQAMAQLGEAIGRYVNIENVINNYMDATKVNRVLAQSKARNSFASNG